MPLPDTDDWRRDNLANWEERVAIHLAADLYDMTPLREGRGRLCPIEEAELGPVDDLRLLHLQCHFGRDTLVLAQRGATTVGLDFSDKAISAARALAGELGVADRARFVRADLYDASRALANEAPFDRVFVTWGAIYWLPDIRGWARIVADQLAPGGRLYLAEGHPTALVFDDEAGADATGFPGRFVSYFESRPLILTDERDYADETARLTNARTHSWMHPLGAIVTALVDAGLTLDWLHEHDNVPWQMFECLVRGEDRMYRWPAEPWLPLAFSLSATKPRR